MGICLKVKKKNLERTLRKEFVIGTENVQELKLKCAAYNGNGTGKYCFWWIDFVPKLQITWKYHCILEGSNMDECLCTTRYLWF